MTGYPSIDKPWLKYYKPEDIAQPLPACSMYDYIRDNNRGHEKQTAFTYFDLAVTYGELFQNIETAAVGFSALGVKEGDIVSFLAITSPEVLYCIYGLNRLGAICNMIDPRMPAGTVQGILAHTKSDCLVVLDVFAQVVIDCHITNCRIVILPSGQLPHSAEIPFPHMTWETLRQHVQAGHTVSDAPYVKDRPALIEYTGGTTGEPKGVLLSNDNANAMASQMARTKSGIQRGQSWLTPAAPFITYVMLVSTHTPLALGQICNIVIYDPETIALETMKNRYNHIAASPLMWENIIRQPEAEKHDFSHLIAPITGADAIDPKLEQAVNEYITHRGCRWKLCQGYGMSETAAAGSMNQEGDGNRPGSVGLPFINTTISIFDTEAQNELPYGETGEICISGPSVMLGYFGDKEATNNVIRHHDDGLLWLHSGDLGHMDRDGFVYIDGRIKRMVVCYNGAKLFPPYIEKILMQSPDVRGCSVVGMQDPAHTIGKVPAAFIIRSDTATGSNEEIIERLKTICWEHLPEYEWPVRWQFIDAFPRTPASKIDYRALEQQLV